MTVRFEGANDLLASTSEILPPPVVADLGDEDQVERLLGKLHRDRHLGEPRLRELAAASPRPRQHGGNHVDGE